MAVLNLQFCIILKKTDKILREIVKTEVIMDINQLNCFITVAQTLNFSEAARRNYVSQSTVSRYVSDLEKEFGVQLFTRSHRDVIITSEGKAYTINLTIGLTPIDFNVDVVTDWDTANGDIPVTWN